VTRATTVAPTRRPRSPRAPQEAPATHVERLAALDRMRAEAEARHARLEAQGQELAEMNTRREERLAAQTARPVPPPVDPRA
jgi:hypothetical protein